MIGPTNAGKTGGTVGTDLKPIKLVNGVATAVSNDLVDVKTQQFIEARKLFKMPANSIAITAYTDVAYSSGNQNSPLIGLCPSSSQVAVGTLYAQQNSATTGMAGYEIYNPSTGYAGGLYLRTYTETVNNQTVTRAYAQVPWLATPTNDNMVLTRGNGVTLTTVQTISGNKTHTGTVQVTAPAPGSSLVRNITISTSAPTSSDGNNGDIWVQY